MFTDHVYTIRCLCACVGSVVSLFVFQAPHTTTTWGRCHTRTLMPSSSASTSAAQRPWTVFLRRCAPLKLQCKQYIRNTTVCVGSFFTWTETWHLSVWKHCGSGKICIWRKRNGEHLTPVKHLQQWWCGKQTHNQMSFLRYVSVEHSVRKSVFC